MKYLLFTLEYPPFKGGVANYYENLVKHWPSHTKALDKKSGEIFILDNNNGELINKNLPFLRWLPAIINLRKKIKNKKINYVIVGNVLPLGTATYFLSKFLKFKYAIILHGTDIAYSQKTARKRKITNKILKQANKIICNSSNTFELTQKATSFDIQNKTLIVNPGINSDFKIDKNLKEDLIKRYNLENKFVLLSLSRLIKRKGQDKIIQALQETVKTIPNLELFIAGDGEDKRYLEEIKNAMLMIKNKVHFLGKISDEEKWAWYDICDIFILPSREEKGNMDGFGIVYLEANLIEKPVIAGDSGGIKDAVKEGINGVLVDPNNTDEISDTIIKLARDKNLREKLGEQGKQRAIKDFDWKKQIEKIYNHVSIL